MNEKRMRSGKAITKVLVVEDDLSVVNLLRANLLIRGYDTIVSVDGSEALSLLDKENPDIILLDLMLPDIDGFELCRTLRERSNAGIIVISARRGEKDKVNALNLGADDYMTKPFSIEELFARIVATLRRIKGDQREPDGEKVLKVGDIVIELSSQSVMRKGQRIHLTPTEFMLLRELVENRGKLLTHAQLLRRVWGPGYETETEYLRAYIRRLRQKLEGEGSAPIILTQPRAGYWVP
jgi:two-component system KDP operon response regulator KdpE